MRIIDVDFPLATRAASGRPLCVREASRYAALPGDHWAQLELARPETALERALAPWELEEETRAINATDWQPLPGMVRRTRDHEVVQNGQHF